MEIFWEKKVKKLEKFWEFFLEGSGPGKKLEIIFLFSGRKLEKKWKFYPKEEKKDGGRGAHSIDKLLRDYEIRGRPQLCTASKKEQKPHIISLTFGEFYAII